MIKEAVEKLMQAGREAAGLKIETNTYGEPFAVKPDGSIVNMAEFYPPRRIKARPSFVEVGSFVAYVNRFKSLNTLIFASLSETGATFTAILDYHGVRADVKGENYADYCAHVATFSLVKTPDWSAWTEQNREPAGQVDFATWLEDQQHLFNEPSGAELLELVRNLFGKKDAAFNSSIRLDNGAYSVGYQEDIEIQAKTGSGSMKLPAELIAEMSVFEGLEKKAIRARLKTRVQDRKLWLFFETIQMEQIVRDCIMAAVAEIATKTEIVPMLGSPN